MPHYELPTWSEAHGMVIAPLNPNQDPDTAANAIRDQVRNPTSQQDKDDAKAWPDLTVQTISIMEHKPRAANEPAAKGEVVVVFVNATQDMGDTQAHAEMDALEKKIGRLKAAPTGPGFFTGGIEHY